MHLTAFLQNQSWPQFSLIGKRKPWKSAQEQGSPYFHRAPGVSFSKFVIRKYMVLVKTYTAQTLPVLYHREVSVEYGQITKILTVTLVSGGGPNLLGRNWPDYLKLWSGVNCQN